MQSILVLLEVFGVTAYGRGLAFPLANYGINHQAL